MQVTQSRYHRQILLPQIGQAGQDSLLAARVLIVGCGALGSTIAEQLARAGVGHLRIADRDIVELTNLQRQVLFDESDARQGLPKVVAAAQRLAKINSEIAIEPRVVDVDADNIEDLVSGVDLILDGTDNVATRYLINDVSVKLGIPWVYGACVGTEGRVMVIRPKIGPCLRCIFPQPADPSELATCDTAGVLGPVAAVVGAMQALAAIKLISSDRSAEVDPAAYQEKALTLTLSQSTERGDKSDAASPSPSAQEDGAPSPSPFAQRDYAPPPSLCAQREVAPSPSPCTQGEGRGEGSSGQLLSIDLWTNRIRVISLQDAKRADCPACGRGELPFLESPDRDMMVRLCGRNAVQVRSGSRARPLTLSETARRLRNAGQVQASDFMVRCTLPEGGLTLTVFVDGRVIVQGTADPARARSIVARYIGS